MELTAKNAKNAEREANTFWGRVRQLRARRATISEGRRARTGPPRYHGALGSVLIRAKCCHRTAGLSTLRSAATEDGRPAARENRLRHEYNNAPRRAKLLRVADPRSVTRTPRGSALLSFFAV
jgi:hypothetical protein